MKLVWKGPFEDGITQSLMTKFDECPFRFFLYCCGLRDTGPPAENLTWGSILHKGLEYRLRGDDLYNAVEKMRQYMYKAFPSAPSTYAHTTAQMLKLYPVDKTIAITGSLDTEIKFEEYLTIPDINKPVIVKGIVDFLSKSRLYMGDHKCKGRIYPMETQAELKTDLQMNLYAYIFEIENWIYDLIAIPEDSYRVLPYQPGQDPMKYADKIFNQYYDTANGFPIANCKDRWICQIPFFQPMEEIDLYFRRTIIPFIKRMIEWWEYVSSTDFEFDNPDCYNSIFYQKPIRMFDPGKTEKFKCNFYQYLTGQQELQDLSRTDNLFQEFDK